MTPRLRPLRGVLPLCALLLAPTAAFASTLELNARVPTAAGDGWIIPCVFVGLEGDASPGTTAYRNRDGYHPELRTTVAAGDALALDFTLAGAGLPLATVTLLDDRGDTVLWSASAGVPTDDLAGLLDPTQPFTLGFDYTDGTAFHVDVTLQTEGGDLDPGSIVAFNPQPDPPAIDGGLALQLGLRTTAASTRVTAQLVFTTADPPPEVLRVVLADPPPEH